MYGRFKWCFIGTGLVANRAAKSIMASGQHEIVSVYSRNEATRDGFAAQFDCISCEDARSAITAHGVQAVYIATPHNSHYEYAKLALESGKPVLCEKPFTTDAKQAEELFSLAREKGLYLAEAMWTWFSPVARRIKQWLDDGELGKLQRSVFNYHMDVRSYGKRLTDPARAGGALLDTGIYPISYIYRLFGKPIAISCKGSVKNGIDLRENVVLSFPDGSKHIASVSMCDNDGGLILRLVGTKAEIYCSPFHSAAEAVLHGNDGSVEIFTGDGSYANEFTLAADEILSGRVESRYVPPSATIDVLKIMDECRRQLGLVYPFENQ